MREYLVSIIIPVFNIEKYIARCLDSIIKQDVFKKIEVIIVNDGSTDKSLEICEKYRDKYENIIIFSQKNSGVSAARNRGISLARGKYIMFVDGDDFIENNYVEHLLTNIINSNVDMIVSNYWIYFSPNNKKKYRNNIKNGEINSSKEAIISLLTGNNIGNNLFDKIFVKDKIGSLKFNESIKIGEDLLFIYNYLKNINSLKQISFVGYNYVQRNGSAMNSKFNEKQFDILNVEKIIREDLLVTYPELKGEIDVFAVHCKYKLLERAYKSSDYSCYDNNIKKIHNDIRAESIVKCWKYLSKKQFCGFILMRYCPWLYIFVCKIKKI